MKKNIFDSMMYELKQHNIVNTSQWKRFSGYLCHFLILIVWVASKWLIICMNMIMDNIPPQVIWVVPILTCLKLWKNN